MTDPVTLPVSEVDDRVYRAILSRYPQVDLFERVSSPEEWDVLYAVESLTNPRLRDEAGDIRLVHPGLWQPLPIRRSMVEAVDSTRILVSNIVYPLNLVKIERRIGILERSLPTNRDVSKPDMIEQFRDGYGNVIVVDYAALTDPLVYSTNGACSWNPDLSNPAPPSPSSGSGYPNRCINAPVYVVASVRSSDGWHEAGILH